MGGRGAKSFIPNARKAIIFGAKLKNYLLHPTKGNGKASFFRSLGYRMQNFRRMKSDIISGLRKNPAKERILKNKYGHKAYNVEMELGINKKAQVLTGWIVDKGDNRPRFVTAYPAERKKDV